MTLLIEKQPRGDGWRFAGTAAAVPERNSTWVRGRFRVISSLPMAELPQSGGQAGLTWHVSIARRGTRRPTDEEVRRVLRAFDLRGAEEDNHMPGRARHFFQPVDPRYRGVCECKTTEATLVERDGFRWQNAIDGSRCGGCAFELLSGNPCPIHKPERVVIMPASSVGKTENLLPLVRVPR